MSEKPDGDAKHPRPGCTPSLPKIGSVIARDVRHLRRGSARSLPPVFSDIDIQTVRHKKESGTIEQINVTPVSRFTFTLAKLLPYWLIGLFVLTVAMCLAWAVYGLTPEGAVGSIYLGAILFILTISGFSLTIANYSETMQQTMFVMFFFIMIFMLMSGLLTPIDSMPAWARKITVVLPPRYFVEILRSVYLKGATLAELWSNYLALGIFATLFNTLAAVTYKKQA